MNITGIEWGGQERQQAQEPKIPRRPRKQSPAESEPEDFIDIHGQSSEENDFAEDPAWLDDLS